MRKRLSFLFIGLCASILSFYLYKQAYPSFQQIDYRLKDARFRIRGQVKPDKDVVVVAIDHPSIKELGRWPWSREVTARLVAGLKEYGAKVSALDIVFSEPQNNAADAALASAIKDSGNVIMGYFFREEEQKPDPQSLEQLVGSQVKLMKIAEGVTSIPLTEYPSMDLNLPSLGRGALDFGFFNATPDSDGLYRRALLLLMHDGTVYPSLAMKALRHYLGSEIAMEIKEWGIDSLFVGNLRIPSRENGTMALNYYGPKGSFPVISAADVINRRLKKDQLKDKIVFVGATEIGIYDIRATPFDATLPGIEIHATVAANALERRFLRYDGVTQQLEIVSVCIIPLLMGLILAFTPGTLAGLSGMVILLGGFFGFNYSMFTKAFHDMTILYPFMGLSIAYIGSEAYRNLVVEKKGRHLKKAFSSYVSPDLVRQIEKDPDKLVLGGEQREISILFSDIRGFTTVSESLTPQELVKLLNEYLTPMTRIVLEERGTLDKFIGDAVMAIFNAPLDVEGHPSHACRAAVRMLAELKSLNEGFSARGMHTLDIGVGINTGLAVVGNMGADIRFDYTAIGDSVNLASRLEGLNKYYGSHILVSEDTRNAVTDPTFIFREVDRVKVKGKLNPIVMYELMINNHDIQPEFESALENYRNREFDKALAKFNEMADKHSDGPSRLYAERCRDYLEHPPQEDWDGVYVAKNK